MIKVKEYNFACEIVKVDLSVGPTYSSLATIKRANETDLGNFHIGLLIVKLKNLEVYNRYLESYNFTACLVFYFINVNDVVKTFFKQFAS